MHNGKYTVLLKSIMENEQTKLLLEKALSTYPLYAQKNFVDGDIPTIPTREMLNQKILNHYKYREIGFETVGRFLDELEIAMNEIMPFYNQMLESVDIMNDIEDIFGNVDVTEKITEVRTNTTLSETSAQSLQTSSANNSTESDAQSSSNNTSLTKRHDTPQGEISSLDKYLTEATNQSSNTANSGHDEAVSTSSANATAETLSSDEANSSGTFEHTYHKKGNQGVNTFAHDIIEFRQTILNVEQMIINDNRISELFMLVY